MLTSDGAVGPILLFARKLLRLMQSCNVFELVDIGASTDGTLERQVHPQYTSDTGIMENGMEIHSRWDFFGTYLARTVLY
jgi:hypothetical protein